MSADSPFWSAARHADRRPFLMARARALSAVRAWFAREGFIEADVGAWVQSPGAETHIQAFETQGRFLHASPEFAMKKLLAAGEEKIFFLGKVYRAGERGPLHAPEFTMLEWYRAGAPYEAIEADSVEIARIVCESVGAQELSWRGQACDPFAAPQRLSVKDAFAAFAPSPPRGEGAASSPPPPCGEGAGGGGRSGSRDGHSLFDPPTDDFSKIITAHVEPRLGQGALTLLREYPISEASLARKSPANPDVAERFELYACGVELANGFGELTDPAEQRARLMAAMAEKARLYGAAWPIDEDFLAALAHMPPASGCALGFDRLLMLAAGAVHIDQVLWTPPQ